MTYESIIIKTSDVKPPLSGVETPKSDGLGVLVQNRTLYHGSSIRGILEFNTAEESTVGEGVYFTSRKEDAEGYAYRRSKSRNGHPTVYEVKIDMMRFCDLRDDKNVKTVLDGFAKILKEERKRDDLSWNYEEVLHRAIMGIANNQMTSGNIRNIAFNLGKLFTDYIKSLGFEGLITFEGGEGQDIGNHDTYVVFDSSRLPEIKEIDVQDRLLLIE